MSDTGKVLTIDNAITAINVIIKLWPEFQAAVGYLTSAGITEADIDSLKAQDKAAADQQQAAIDAAKERESKTT